MRKLVTYKQPMALSFTYPTLGNGPHRIMRERDYRLLLKVARAADSLKHSNGVRCKWPEWLLPLEKALDALNALNAPAKDSGR